MANYELPVWMIRQSRGQAMIPIVVNTESELTRLQAANFVVQRSVRIGEVLAIRNGTTFRYNPDGQEFFDGVPADKIIED